MGKILVEFFSVGVYDKLDQRIASPYNIDIVQPVCDREKGEENSKIKIRRIKKQRNVFSDI